MPRAKKTPKPVQRQWSDTQVALALAVVDAHGGNVEEAARYLEKTTLPVPSRTLQAWYAGERRTHLNADIQRLRGEMTGELANTLGVAAMLGILELIKALPQIPSKDLAIVVGILVDKRHLLLTGEQPGEPGKAAATNIFNVIQQNTSEA